MRLFIKLKLPSMLTQTLQRVFRQYNLFSPDERLVLAVSGGADSLALMAAIARLRKRARLNILVATLDHGLRPEARQEVRHVYIQAQSLGLACTVGCVSVGQQAKRRRWGLEETARHLRYRFLARVAHSIGAQKVVTAHHADDQAETVLMHLLRGSGSYGAAGMRVVSSFPDDPDLLLVRPLLWTRRDEIELFIDQQGLTPCEDASNIDLEFWRNQIRHVLLPAIEQVGGKPAITALTRFAAIHADEQALLDDLLIALWEHVDWPQAGVVQYARDRLVSLHIALRRRMLVALVVAVGGVPAYETITAGLALLERGRSGSVSRFAGGIALTISGENIVIGPEDRVLPT